MARTIRITFLVYAILFFVLAALTVLISMIWFEEVWSTQVLSLLAPTGIATLTSLGVGSYLGFRSRFWQEVKTLVNMQIVLASTASLAFALSALIISQSWWIWALALLSILSAAYWTYIMQLGGRPQRNRYVRPKGIDLKEFH